MNASAANPADCNTEVNVCYDVVGMKSNTELNVSHNVLGVSRTPAFEQAQGGEGIYQEIEEREKEGGREEERGGNRD